MFNPLIVVPYRDRREHLLRFAPHIEQFLPNGRIVVVEQSDTAPFNRAKLINTGFCLFRGQSQDIVIHDVDMLPVDASCDYSPSGRPVHLAGCASQYGYKRPYTDYIGGVLLISAKHFEQCNGMSNEFWGWGQEDDEFAGRLRDAGIGWVRRDGRFQSLPHAPSGFLVQNLSRLQRSAGQCYRSKDDGLSTLCFEELRRQPLCGFLGLSGLRQCHEVVSVDLLWSGPQE